MKHLISLCLVPAMLLASQTACASSQMPTQCTISGTEHFSSGESAEDLCLRFQRALNAKLASEDKALEITLTAEKRGRVKAKITARSDKGVVEYPVVGFAVVDRPLMASDLEKLADAAAKVVGQK